MDLPNNSNVLVIAPHPDDEILGLGGTIKKLSDQGHKITILLVSGHLPPLYKEEVFQEHKLHETTDKQCRPISTSGTTSSSVGVPNILF